MVALMAEWLTPTSLFVLLNIVIATIYFTSAGSNQNNKSRRDETETAATHPQGPSIFSRLASFNFSSTNQHEHYSHPDENQTRFQARPDPTAPALSRAPTLLARVASFCRVQIHIQEPAAEGKVGVISSEESREVPCSDEKKTNKKVEDQLAAFAGGEKKKKVVAMAAKQRKVGGVKTKAAAEAEKSREEEVDAKADDFINKFKQQLKMQRLESLLRYRTPAS